jgi:hypothetical protein
MACIPCACAPPSLTVPIQSHLIASSLFVALWSLVLNALWRRRGGARNIGTRYKVQTWLVMLNAVMLCASIGTIVSCVWSEAFGLLMNSNTYVIFTVCLSGCLLIITIALVKTGLSLSKRIKKAGSGFYSGRRHARMNGILLRLNSVMGVCAFVYFLRAILLIWKMVLEEEGEFIPVGPYLWFALNDWAPGIIPACTILYINRRSKSSSDSRGQPRQHGRMRKMTETLLDPESGISRSMSVDAVPGREVEIEAIHTSQF